MAEETAYKLLQKIRNVGIRDCTPARKLLEQLSKQSGWSDEQCHALFDPLLHYYIKDEQELDLMLAVSGLKDGYQNPELSAASRRRKYLQYLSDLAEDANLVVSEDALEKRETKILHDIEERLTKDSTSGEINQLLIKWGILQADTSLEKSSNHDREESSESTQDSIHTPQEKNFGDKSGYTDKSFFKNSRIISYISQKLSIFSNNKIYLDFSKRNSAASAGRKHRGIIAACVILVIIAAFATGMIHKYINPPVSEILLTSREIILAPNEAYQLKPAVLPVEATKAQLSYVSLDTNIARVDNQGTVFACEVPQGPGEYTTDILIQAESGATARKTITVKVSKSASDNPTTEIDSFSPGFIVEQRARLVGTTEWKCAVENVNIGDKVEFRIQYKNTSEVRQKDVMIIDSLPTNMRLVSGSTVAYNANHPNGFTLDDDGIIDAGINLGNYDVKSNAVVTFTAEIVDNTLQPGSNTLVNWAQVGVGAVALQDFVIITLTKEP